MTLMARPAKKFSPLLEKQVIELVERGRSQHYIANHVGLRFGQLKWMLQRLGVSTRESKFRLRQKLEGGIRMPKRKTVVAEDPLLTRLRELHPERALS